MPLSVTVTSESTVILSTLGKSRDKSMGAKYLRVSNMSNNYVFLSFGSPAEVNKGLVLAPKGTPGWFVEFNNDNMIYSTLYGIASGSSQLAILVGG